MNRTITKYRLPGKRDNPTMTARVEFKDGSGRRVNPVGEVKRASELDGPDYYLITNSQDIDAIIELIGKVGYKAYNSGLIVKVSDGDYEEVWSTDSSAPFLKSAMYGRIK